MRAHPPKLFLDTATGAVRAYQHYPITLIPAAHQLVTHHYHPVAVVDGVTVYERDASTRRPAGPSPAPASSRSSSRGRKSGAP